MKENRKVALKGSSVMARGTLNEGTTVATVADLKSLVFKGNVIESDIVNLKINMPLIFSFSIDL